MSQYLVTLLTSQLSLAVCDPLLSVVLASVGIFMETFITSGFLPLERYPEGKVSMH